MNLKQVQKGLSQEEMTLVNNISSLISELKSASGVQAGVEQRDGQPPIEQPSQISTKMDGPSPSDKMEKADPSQADPSPSDKMEKAKDEKPSPSPSPSKSVSKDETNTASDGATANDDAEERMIDALSEVNVENVDEVKKAVRMLKDLQSVRLMKSRSISPLASAIVELTKVVKSIQSEQNETQMALKNILDGIGVTQQMSIQKSAPVSRPIVDNDNEAMAKVVKSLLQEVVKSSVPQDDRTIGKNTSIALSNIEKSLNALGSMIPSYNKGNK